MKYIVNVFKNGKFVECFVEESKKMAIHTITVHKTIGLGFSYNIENENGTVVEVYK